MTEKRKTPSIFISYSREDEHWKKRLMKQLRVVETQGNLTVWDDRQIQAGEDWLPAIEKAINAAPIAILLISVDFLTSNFILKKEVPDLLEKRNQEGARIIPLIVKPCAWQEVGWLSGIQCRPLDASPLSGATEHDAEMALMELTSEISGIIKSLASNSQVVSEGKQTDDGQRLDAIEVALERVGEKSSRDIADLKKVLVSLVEEERQNHARFVQESISQVEDKLHQKMEDLEQRLGRGVIRLEDTVAALSGQIAHLEDKQKVLAKTVKHSEKRLVGNIEVQKMQKSASGSPKHLDRNTILLAPGVSMTLIWLEPGTVMMGSSENEGERDDREIQHQVTLTKGFWMGETVVTWEQWLAVMEHSQKHPEDLTHPVTDVSWEDIQEFNQKLNQKIAGAAFCLPTEAQWEYACRAGTTTSFSFGANINPEQVNYDGNNPYNEGPKGFHRGKTVSVKALPANDWGLYQMHGNVWEWCADWYDKYSADATVDPSGPETGQDRVLRGGSWFDPARLARSACRLMLVPFLRDDSMGFRLAQVNPALLEESRG